METQLRAALVAWLQADPAVTAAVNLVAEEAPVRAAPPWLGIAASASTDWSTKDRRGREVRVAFELHSRGNKPASADLALHAIEARLAAFPAAHDGFEVAGVVFLRSRAEQRPGNVRATLLEYRFRLLSTEN